MQAAAIFEDCTRQQRIQMPCCGAEKLEVSQSFAVISAPLTRRFAEEATGEADGIGPLSFLGNLASSLWPGASSDFGVQKSRQNLELHLPRRRCKQHVIERLSKAEAPKKISSTNVLQSEPPCNPHPPSEKFWSYVTQSRSTLPSVTITYTCKILQDLARAATTAHQRLR